MGLSDFEQILMFLHRWFPEAFFPKCKEVDVAAARTTKDISTLFFKQSKTEPSSGAATATAFDPDQIVWPSGLGSLGYALDEMNGTVRTLPLGTKEERLQWHQEGKRQAREQASGLGDDDEEEEDPDREDADGCDKPASSAFSGRPPSEESADEEFLSALLYPEDLVKYFLERYSRIFYYNNAGEIHVVWDCIGCTPAIKGILRTPQPSKRVVWPKGSPRESLFTGNHRFQNSIHDYFADKEARFLLYEFLTAEILERFPKEGYFPEGCRLVVWGGRYAGQDCPKPLYVEHDPLKGPTPVSVIDDPTAPQAEADVLIGYIVRKFIAHGHIMVLSKDSDFIPILLSVVNSHYKHSKAPKKYRVFFSHKVLVKSKISKEEHAKLQRDLAVNNTSSGVPEDDDIDAILKSFGDEPATEPRTSSSPPALVVDHFSGTATSPPLTPKGSPVTPPSARKRKASSDPDGQDSKEMVEIKARIREVIDVNTLYERVWTLMHATHRTCTLCDPLDAFLAMAFLSGCDYMKKLPFVSFKTLCYVYLTPETHKQVGCLCPYDAGVFRLRLSSFKNLAALAYKHFRNIKNEELKTPQCISYEDVRNAMVKRKDTNAIKAALTTKKAAERMPQQAKKARRAPEYLPPEKPERYAANLVWVVNYYTRSNQAGWPRSNGLEVDERSGLSLYGYRAIKSSNPKQKDKYAFADEVLTRDVF
jgi:hypothetical protein